MVEKAKTYHILDLMKFICALLVVGIHTEPFAAVNILDKGFAVITRIAVPFFFVTSSFFYFKKPTSFQGFLNFAARLLSIYISWILIYEIISLLRGQRPDVDFLIYSIFVRGYSHFWYLLALVVSVGLCSVLLKVLKNPKIVTAIALMLYVWATLCSTYQNWFPVSDPIIRKMSVRNGIHYAPIFIMIGYLFANRKDKRTKPVKSLMLTLVLFVLLIVEGIAGVLLVKPKMTILWFTTPFLMYAFFSTLLSVEVTLPDRISVILRKLSVGIYCVHPIIVAALQAHGFSGITLFLLVSGISCVISYWIMEMQKKEKYWFFKKLL